MQGSRRPAADRRASRLPCAIAIADYDRVYESVTEQLLRRLDPARRVDMQSDRVIADRDPGPGLGSSGLPREVPGCASWSRLHERSDTPCSNATKDRLVQRARTAARADAGWSASVPGETCQPLVPTSMRQHRCTRRKHWRTLLEQEACPEAGHVERPGEQPRHRVIADTSMGDDAHVAGPAPARRADHASMSTLDARSSTGCATILAGVRRIELPLNCRITARIQRRVVLFGALIEPGRLGAADGWAKYALMAALVFRARIYPAARSCAQPGRSSLECQRLGRTKYTQAGLPA